MFQVDYEPPKMVSPEDSVDDALKGFSKQASNETKECTDYHMCHPFLLNGHVLPFITTLYSHSDLMIKVRIGFTDFPALVKPSFA